MPSPRVRGQLYCGKRRCQQARRRAYQKKLATDQAYRQKLMPVVTVEAEEGLVLIDGYLSYQALSRLDRDSILVQVYAAGELAALLMLLGHGQGRHWESIEQAFISSLCHRICPRFIRP